MQNLHDPHDKHPKGRKIRMVGMIIYDHYKHKHPGGSSDDKGSRCAWDWMGGRPVNTRPCHIQIRHCHHLCHDRIPSGLPTR